MAFDREYRAPGFAPFSVTSSNSDVWEGVVDSTFWEAPSTGVSGSATVAVPVPAAAATGALAITASTPLASTPPTFQAAGAISGSTGTVTPAWPTHAADDIALLFVETANQAITLDTASGFVEITGLQNGGGTAGSGADASRLAVFWCRATSGSMASPVVSDAGQHTIARIVTFRGAVTSGDPWDVVSGDASGTATSAVSIPGATTTVANTLVVLACSWADDSASGSLSSVTNADLTSLTSHVDEGNVSGNGGGLAVLSGVKATAGAFGTSTGTLALAASYQGRAAIALRPAAGASDNIPTPSASGTGTISSAAITGSASVAVPAPAAAATGALSLFGSASIAVPVPSAAGLGILPIAGSAAPSVPVPASAGASTLSLSGVAAVAVPVPSVSATGALAIVGSATVAVPVPSVSAAGTSNLAPSIPTTTTPTLRALLIANIAAIDAQGSPGFRAYRHDQAVSFTDWCDANPAGAFRRYAVRDYGFDTLESVNQSGLEWRRVQLRITVAYPHTNRAGAQGAVSRDALMRIDRHAIEVATGLRAYVSLETLPAVYLSSRASKALGTACDFLVIDAVYGFFATPV